MSCIVIGSRTFVLHCSELVPTPEISKGSSLVMFDISVCAASVASCVALVTHSLPARLLTDPVSNSSDSLPGSSVMCSRPRATSTLASF